MLFRSEEFKGQLGANGNRADSAMAKAGLTARGTSRAGAKAEHSEPTVRIRCGGRLSDKSYSGDNRLVLPKSPNRRQCSAPRCRLISSWGCSRSQGYGCSPFKVVRELGLERRETVRSLSAVGVGGLREAAPSTRGPEWTDRWCSGCVARRIAG